MDLNTQYMIPYLANNSYIYGDRTEPLHKPNETFVKGAQEETLISSIKNPIPCYRQNDPIPSSPLRPQSISSSYSKEDPVCQAAKIPNAYNISQRSQSPISRPLNFSDNQNLSGGTYVQKDYLQVPQSLGFVVNKSENQYVPSSSELYSNERPKLDQRDYSTPSSRSRTENLIPKEKISYSSYKENCYLDTTGQHPDRYQGYMKQEQSIDSRVCMREGSTSSCSRNREIPSYYIDKYLKDTDTRISDFNQYRPKINLYTAGKCQDSSVLTESNSVTPCRSNNEFSTYTQPVRNGAFLDDIIEKYRDKIVERDEKREKVLGSREVSRKSECLYKEDMNKSYVGEGNMARVRPTRDVWMEQAKNTKEFTCERPNLDFSRLGKSSQKLLTKKNQGAKKIKKRGSVRSASSSKERNFGDREAFEKMIVKVLKLHAKHCPALRKEIDSMQTSKLLNI